MPLFEIHGFGRYSGRRRNRQYKADNQDEAAQMASLDGTITESITRLPDPVEPEHKSQPRRHSDDRDDRDEEPATERQKSYAQSLGIEFPAGITKATMSGLISSTLDADLDVLHLMGKLAAKHRTARITYCKFGEAEVSVRIVEPYELVHLQESPDGKECIRCWQLWPPPDDGEHWRTFRTDRIKSVHDGGAGFSPRQEVTLQTGRARSSSIRENNKRAGSGRGFSMTFILVAAIVIALFVVAVVFSPR